MSDLIDRQAAIDAVSEACFELRGVFERCEDALKALPSAQPERKKGKWIKQNPMVDTEECSECGYNIIDEEFETPYCPWCGADMRGEQDD